MSFWFTIIIYYFYRQSFANDYLIIVFFFFHDHPIIERIQMTWNKWINQQTMEE